MRILQVIVVPFVLQRGRLVARGHSPAKNSEAGVRAAHAMSSRYQGVGVYGVMVDDVTYDADDIYEIARFGTVPAVDELQAAA
jgi:hypothetical protein